MFSNPLLAFGELLAFATLLGIVGDWLRLPRVTSYLVAGVLFGPSVIGLVSGEELHDLEPIADIAMTLVLFNLGAHFSIEHLLRIRRHIIPVAIGDLLVPFVLVACGLWMIGQSVSVALMLGCLAMATAPATTVLVLKELRSAGPVTESAQALVAINNLATVIAFEVLMLGFALFGSSGDLGLMANIRLIAWTFGGSLLLGLVLGVGLSFVAGFLSTLQWAAVLLAVSTFVLGLCDFCPFSYMFTFLVTGFVFANTAHDSQQDLVESEKITGLLCISFFAIHGAEMQLNQFLLLGWVGVAYIVLRSVGKYAGIYFAAKWSHESNEMRNWLGSTMLSQAGAAIALASLAVAHDAETFAPVQTIILGSVLVFEVIGPLLIRISVVNSGEVPIAHVARHSSGTIADQWRTMWWQFKKSLGGSHVPIPEAQEMTVDKLTRSKIDGIPQDATLEQIISHIEHSHDSTFAVVNKENQVVGLIRYPLLSESLFDPNVTNLVRAEDLATPVEKTVFPDEPVQALFDFFLKSSDDCIPVVSRGDVQSLMGIVRRADVRTLLIRSRKKGAGH